LSASVLGSIADHTLLCLIQPFTRFVTLALSYLDDVLCHDTTPQGNAGAHAHVQMHTQVG
jgi:hypothetical protein